ncbi:MAG TPA: cysteine synthase family protein [Candidatus Aminicenantes bacterium]|nr:cysteine synthase family protein [Candidatus Aminicenantes bacterium]
MRGSKPGSSVLDEVGRTPLVRLNRIAPGVPAEIYAKLEMMNPMGSVKDRIALFMIEKAESDGRIRPGDTIVDSSSGNTALGLAMVCRLKGYRLRMVIRDSTSSEKIKLLRALNVDLVLVDATLPPESPRSYNNVTPLVARETPNGYYLDQHNSPDNNEAHYRTTGPEIWEQMEGRIDYFVAGVGTGGTICGAGRFLKERDPRIKVVGVDPVGSVFFDYFHSGTLVKPGPYLMEGLGDEFLIECVEFDVLDDMIRIDDRTAFQMTRRLANVEAIFAGGSSGAAVWASLEVARRAGPKARIVTILADSANRYLSTIYNDDWLRQKFGDWPPAS